MKIMKAPLFSILLFIILVGFIFYADRNLVDLCNDVVLYSLEIEDIIEENNKTLAIEKSMELVNLLQQESNIAPVYVNHQDYDNLVNEALKLCLYIKQDDTSETQASLHILRYNADNMKHLQKLCIENIF